MNSIEQLIKQKLQVALEATKQEIATTLIKEQTNSRPGAIKPTMQQQNAKKLAKIAKVQQDMIKKQKSSTTETDPEKTQAKIKVDRQKIALVKAEIDANKS